MTRAILFDFDGLILDTETPIFTAWTEVYEQHGCALTLNEWSACIGTDQEAFDPFRDLEKKAGRSLDWDTLRPRISARYTEIIEQKDALPGVRDFLREARDRGLRIALASSSTRQWVTGHLTRLELLDHFEALRTRDDVERVKPAPDLFLAALACVGTRAEETIVLEDSPNGILAAKRAGIFAVAIPNTLTRDLPLNDPELRISSLADVPLPDLLEKVAQRRTLP